MRTLIAEDDLTSRTKLAALTKKWGFDPVLTENGEAALEVMQRPDAPKLVILDWNMPKLEGVEVCRQIRQMGNTEVPPYIILLTCRGEKEDIVQGLDAGANDYIAKPYDREELGARIHVGRRMVELQIALAQRIRELNEALDHVKTLQGILPICCHCKKIRDDKDYWCQVENYISDHSEIQFSHSICPVCYEKYYASILEEAKERSRP